MKPYIYIVRVPFIALMLNSILFMLAGNWAFGTIIFNIVRILIVVWAAWLLVDNGRVSILAASLVGPLFLFMDHVLLGGIGGLVLHDFSTMQPGVGEEWLFESPRLTYMAGVVISFLMFFPIAMLVAAFGGYAAKPKVKG